MYMAIRPAVADDTDALLRLETLFPSDRMDRRAIRRFIRSPGAWFGVAEVDGQIAGNLLMLTRKGSTTARVYSVVVDPAHRGEGIGHRLVERAEDEARRRRLRHMMLEVRADNAAARGLYERLGYIVTTPLPGYYDDGADGIRMVKRLTPES